MPDTLSILTGIALLAVGTYAMRASGRCSAGVSRCRHTLKICFPRGRLSFCLLWR